MNDNKTNWQRGKSAAPPQNSTTKPTDRDVGQDRTPIALEAFDWDEQPYKVERLGEEIVEYFSLCILPSDFQCKIGYPDFAGHFEPKPGEAVLLTKDQSCHQNSSASATFVVASSNYDEIGRVPMVIHNYNIYISVGAISRISGLPREDVNDFFTPEHFSILSSCENDNVVINFVKWEAASLLCINTADGRLLIACIKQFVIGNVPGVSERICHTMSARLLHEMVPNDVDFADFKQSFRLVYPKYSEGCFHAKSDDFFVPLDFAKKFALDNFCYISMLAYVMMRETEMTDCNTIHESLPLFFRSQPNWLGRVDIRELHAFFKPVVEVPEFMLAVVGNPDLKGEWFPVPVMDANYGDPGNEMNTGFAEMLLSLHAAASIAHSTPTFRGRLLGEYLCIFGTIESLTEK